VFLQSLNMQYEIIALEPHKEMRNFLATKHLSNVQVIDGLAQAIPLTSESVGCVLVAQVTRVRLLKTLPFTDQMVI
jgi:hypothetical protein